MMATEHDSMVFTEIVGDHEIACEYDRLFRCGPQTAEWVLFGNCACGRAGQRLVCTDCKEKVLTTEDGLFCSGCGETIVPARRIFAFVERL